jgi:biotin synthase
MEASGAEFIILQNSSFETLNHSDSSQPKFYLIHRPSPIWMSDLDIIAHCIRKVLSGQQISFEEAEQLMSTSEVDRLLDGANEITRAFSGSSVDVEALVNAKSGRCPEDCSFCAQSSFYGTAALKYPLLPTETLLQHARIAKEEGASSFCIVCAYRSPPQNDFNQICETITRIRKEVGIDVNVSLGFMTLERASRLKEIGVKRYNHNLEAAESYFSTICSTHDFKDRMETARIVKQAGLSLCSGGIIGMGESRRQRLELAFSLALLQPDEVPINILIPKEGTPLHTTQRLDQDEVAKTIAVWRFILPRSIIKIAGGREIHLEDQGRRALKGGANGIITGGYLTTGGNEAAKDMAMIQEIGLDPN